MVKVGNGIHESEIWLYIAGVGRDIFTKRNVAYECNIQPFFTFTRAL
jgi:hypothetical protein